jgi:putative NADH-flavin reductase
VSAIGPHPGAETAEDSLVGGALGLIAGLRKAGVRRLVIVGGAGSLEVAPGVRLVDTPDFPPAWKPTALAHAEVLGLCRETEDLDWTYASPAAVIEPGERTGSFRIGADQLLADEAGESRISIPDFAIAVVDVLERGEAIRRRITVAY